MVKRFLLFKILKKYSHPSIVLLPLFSLFIAVCMGSASKFLSLIVDVVPSGSFMTAILFLAVSVVLRMLSTIAQSIRDYYSDKLSERLAFSIQKDVLEKLDRIPFSTFEEENTQNLVYRIYTNGKIEGINMFRSLSTGLYGILITIIYAVLLGNIVWYIPLLFVLFSLSSLFVSIRFGVSQYILKRQKSKTEQRATYYERLLLRCDAAKEVRFYGLVNTLKERYIDLRKKLAKEERQQITKHIFLELFGKLLQAMGLFLCLAILVTQYYDNTGFVLLSDILLVFNIGLSFFDELNGALLELRNITRFYAFAEDSLSFLELEEEKRDSFPSDVNNIIDIEFDHVSFAYPGSDEYAVRDINVHLHRGEKVICVGENGAGKSTFLMLMLGLYQPTEGRLESMVFP